MGSPPVVVGLVLGQDTADVAGRKDDPVGDLSPGSEQQPPQPDYPVADPSQERIKRRPVLGGLISQHERAA